MTEFEKIESLLSLNRDADEIYTLLLDKLIPLEIRGKVSPEMQVFGRMMFCNGFVVGNGYQGNLEEFKTKIRELNGLQQGQKPDFKDDVRYN